MIRPDRVAKVLDFGLAKLAPLTAIHGTTRRKVRRCSSRGACASWIRPPRLVIHRLALRLWYRGAVALPK
jgi:hypothetical protein